MKYKEMLAFSLFLSKTEGTDSAAWKKAIQSVNQLMEAMGPYQLPMGDGKYRPITPEAYAKIETIFDQAVVAVSEYGKEHHEGPEDEARGRLMKNFNKEFLAKSYIEYKNVKPNPDGSLRDAMENFRYQNVELSDAEMQRLGGNLSSRVQLSIDLDGVKTRGVFTKRSSYDPHGQFKAILDEMGTKYGKFASFFAAMDDPRFLQEGLFGNDPRLFINIETGAVNDATPEARVQAVYNYHDSVGFDLYPNLDREFEKYRDDPDFFNALFEYSIKVEKLSAVITVNEQMLNLKPGENLDGRNSAMSSVANLLGVNDLIAKSKQIAVKMPSGEFQTGTFMEFVESKDISHIDSIDETRVLGLDAYESKDVKVQLANLQVLDYICGNVDRHLGNILYKFDPYTHKLTSIKGIDNDASFTKRRMTNSTSLSQLPSIRRMRVIDQAMAEKLLSIDEGMLGATLHGYGLSEEEVAAAYDRLHSLQEAVKAAPTYDPEKGLEPYLDSNEGPELTIVKSEDWEKLHLEDLRAGNNFFGKLMGVQETLTTESMVNETMKRDLESSKRSLKSMLNPENSAKLLENARSHKPFMGVSMRYQNVLDAMAAYQNAPSPEDPLHSDGHEKWQRLSDLQNAVAAYQQEKIGLGHIRPDGSPSPDMKGKALSRIEDVDKIGKFASLLEQQRKTAIASEEALREAERKQAELDAFKALSPEEQKIILDQRKAHEQYLNQDLSVRIQNSLAEEEESFEMDEDLDLSENLSMDAVNPNQ